MKMLLMVFIVILNTNLYSNDCIEQTKKELIETVSSKLNISHNKLKVRYIGGESLDGDYTNDGLYQDNAWEYFDVFLKTENPKQDSALVMFLVEMSVYSNEQTGDVDCELNSINSVDTDDWNEIYRTYL